MSCRTWISRRRYDWNSSSARAWSRRSRISSRLMVSGSAMKSGSTIVAVLESRMSAGSLMPAPPCPATAIIVLGAAGVKTARKNGLSANGHQQTIRIHRRAAARMVLEVQMVGAALGVPSVPHVTDYRSRGHVRPVRNSRVRRHVGVIGHVAVVGVYECACAPQVVVVLLEAAGLRRVDRGAERREDVDPLLRPSSRPRTDERLDGFTLLLGEGGELSLGSTEVLSGHRRLRQQIAVLSRGGTQELDAIGELCERVRRQQDLERASGASGLVSLPGPRAQHALNVGHSSPNRVDPRLNGIDPRLRE